MVLLTAMGGEDNAPLLLGGFVLLGFGLETTLFGAYESMLSEAPQDQAGGAAAIGETSYQLGAGIGIALLGSVMNAAYAPGLSQVPGVPASASAAAAHSLGEAYEVAARLGGPAGEALRLAARHSFVHGLHVTLLVSAGLLLAGAAMALRLPRLMHCDPEETFSGPASGASAAQAGSAAPSGPESATSPGKDPSAPASGTTAEASPGPGLGGTPTRMPAQRGSRGSGVKV